MRLEGNRREAVLYLSMMGFVALTGILAVAYFFVIGTFAGAAHGQVITAKDLHTLVFAFALPSLPGAALSWWLAVVIPRRPEAFTGGLAGLLTVVFAVLGAVVTLVAGDGSLLRTLPPQALWHTLVQALQIWLFGLAFVFVTPVGWGVLAVGMTVGALYGAGVRRYLLSERR